MGKYCTSNQILKNQRRINGLQLPLNFQQICSWTVLIIAGIINFSIVSLLQFKELKIISLTFFTILYVSHTAFHIAALTIDPAEKDLRNRETFEVPEFDRTLHSHVIENGRCHLCNIYTSNKKTKHCGLCNKCVFEFDHHCKWLNNCIGERNYFAFIGCVATALFISILTSALCIADVVLFLKQPQLLSSEAQRFFNCTTTMNNVKFCHSSIFFLTFLIMLSISGIALACTLLHLCCFHIYISFLGVSTYEYIVKKKTTVTENATFCRKNYQNNRKKEKTTSCDVPQTRKKVSEINKNDTNVTNLINVLIASELNRAVKIFSSEKNKVHPHQVTENR